MRLRSKYEIYFINLFGKIPLRYIYLNECIRNYSRMNERKLILVLTFEEMAQRDRGRSSGFLFCTFL